MCRRWRRHHSLVPVACLAVAVEPVMQPWTTSTKDTGGCPQIILANRCASRICHLPQAHAARHHGRIRGYDNTRTSPGLRCLQAPSSPRRFATAGVGVATVHPPRLLRGWCSLVDHRVAHWQMASSGVVSHVERSNTTVRVQGKLSTLHALFRQQTGHLQGMHRRVRNIT